MNKKDLERTLELESIDKKHIWHPFTQMKEWMANNQIVIEKGKGNYIIDTNGNSYLDGISSLWVTVHGHNHPHINKAIKNQLNKISHSTFLGLSNVPAIKLAEKLIKLVPQNLTRIFYSDNGSTSVEIGLKIAYQYWQQHPNSKYHTKKKFISFSTAYHGDTIGSVSVGGIDLYHKIYKPLLFDVIQAPYPNPLKQKLNKEECEEKCLKELEKLMGTNQKQVAGLIIEPLMQGASGMINTTSHFLQKVKELCIQYNILLIVDEVATGFGRTGAMFAVEKADIQPDILCVAKGLTGGYLPLAATITTEEIFNNFLGEHKDNYTFFHGHTYTANPLACAAAIANLELFEKNNTIEALQEKIYRLITELKEIAKLPHVIEVRQEGFMVGIELCENKKTKKYYAPEKRVGSLVCQEAIKNGVFLRPLGDTIVLIPPLSIDLKELKFLLDTCKKCIIRITQN